MAEEELTPEERTELSKLLGGSAPVPDEKHNVHTFISKVLTTQDTTKVGNLNEAEIGMTRNPVRAYKEGAIWARNVIKCEGAAKILSAYAEIATATSLSRQAALLRFATTMNRTIADVTKPKVENKSWFKKKKEPEQPVI